MNASILQPSYARVDEGLLQPAKARATPYVAEAKARATPYVAEAKARATPYVAEAKARATPYVAPYIARGLDTKDAVLSDVRCPQPAPELQP